MAKGQAGGDPPEDYRHLSQTAEKQRQQIPPTRFELVSPDPKSCMIDRYTTGVDYVLDEYTRQIPKKKICPIPFRA
jgi:hypothetical protein